MRQTWMIVSAVAAGARHPTWSVYMHCATDACARVGQGPVIERGIHISARLLPAKETCFPGSFQSFTMRAFGSAVPSCRLSVRWWHIINSIYICDACARMSEAQNVRAGRCSPVRAHSRMRTHPYRQYRHLASGVDTRDACGMRSIGPRAHMHSRR